MPQELNLQALLDYRYPQNRFAAAAINDLLLGKVSRSEWFKCRSRKAECGIYGLFENEELVYIGRTRNLTRRIKAHRRTDRKTSGFTGVSYIAVSLEDHNTVEYRLIQSFCPKYNHIY